MGDTNLGFTPNRFVDNVVRETWAALQENTADSQSAVHDIPFGPMLMREEEFRSTGQIIYTVFNNFIAAPINKTLYISHISEEHRAHAYAQLKDQAEEMAQTLPYFIQLFWSMFLVVMGLFVVAYAWRFFWASCIRTHFRSSGNNIVFADPLDAIEYDLRSTSRKNVRI